MLRKIFEDFGWVESQKHLEWQKWFGEQIRKINSGEEIEPPWIVYPHSSPIYGWNQGYQEAWLKNIWLPFWQSLDANQRQKYLEKWHPPMEEWREYLTVHWIRS